MKYIKIKKKLIPKIFLLYYEFIERRRESSNQLSRQKDGFHLPSALLCSFRFSRVERFSFFSLKIFFDSLSLSLSPHVFLLALPTWKTTTTLTLLPFPCNHLMSCCLYGKDELEFSYFF